MRMAFQCDKISSKRFLGMISVNAAKYAWQCHKGQFIGPLLFNIFINDIFHLIQEAYICNFVDNNSLYLVEDNLKDVKTIVKKNFKLVQA